MGLQHDYRSLRAVQEVTGAIPKLRTTTSGSNTYYGLAAPGTLTSQARWIIFRVDSSGNIDHADGNEEADNVWDNVLTLSYS